MQQLHIRNLGRTDYAANWHAMQAFTAQRDADSADELWLTEHDAVYTLGLNRRDVQLPERNDIALIQTDRGGKMTYHGPGQLVVYLLLDLRRKGWHIRDLVSAMENAIIALLAQQGIVGHARSDAPGVYVDAAKIASLGLRLKNGCCYHGLALNVAMDLKPFAAIAPCGFPGLQVTQMRTLGSNMSMADTGSALIEQMTRQLNCAPVSLEIHA